MPTATVNGVEVELRDGEKLNCIQAAARAGFEVPHYCWHPDLTVVASCRMCLVEVGETKPDGTVAMQPKVVPGCQTPVKPGTVVVTNSERARAAQAGTLEYILLDHPLDCPICDQAGECYLQDYSYKFGKAVSRLDEPKTYHPDKHYIGDQIVLFTDRCVMCSRCVRFTREFSGTGELQIINRGNHAEIDIFPGQPCNNKLAGNVVDICPVGALCSKDFLYKQRVWWLQTADSVCPNCSTGCSIHVDQNDDRVYRLRARPNPEAQGSFMCDLGRFGWKYVHRDDRLQIPVLRESPAADPAMATWEEAIEDVRTNLRRFAPAVVGVLSPWMTVEEAYLTASFLKSLSSMTRLVMGPIPVEGDDDHYPKGPDGKPEASVRFTIHAEKCPNRRGVEAVLEHFEGRVAPWEAALRDVGTGGVAAAFVVGGYNGDWISQEAAAALGRLTYVAAMDILPTALTDSANAVLPGASFVEKEGTFVNQKGLAQRIKPAIRPIGEARPDGRILMELAGRRGLFHAPTLRKEIAETIPALAALGIGDLGEFGVRLDAVVPETVGAGN
jgi:NADH-quinone oxidoreductase subunit G